MARHACCLAIIASTLLVAGCAGRAARESLPRALRERPAAALDGYRLATPAAVMRWMERSNVRYRVRTLAELKGVDEKSFADIYWPQDDPLRAFPYLADGPEGRPHVVEYALGDGCLPNIAAVEKLQKSGRSRAALKAYRGILAESPSCYIANAHLGDSLLSSGDVEGALERYTQVIVKNPYDHRAFLRKANALAGLERYDEALAFLAHALVLRPRFGPALDAANGQADQLDVSVMREPFRPRALARREGNDVVVYAPEGSPHWVMYGVVKAIWLAEPEYRRAMIGRADRHWSTEEDMHALTLLSLTYADAVDRGRIASEPQLDRLRRIVDERMVYEFVLYEMGTRVNPHLTLQMHDEMRARLHRFIETFVLVKRDDEERSAVPASHRAGVE